MCCTVKYFVHTVPKFKNRKIINFSCVISTRETCFVFIISVIHTPFEERRGWRNGQRFGQYSLGFFITANIAMIGV